MHPATGYKGSVAIARCRALRLRSASCARLDAEYVRDKFLHQFGGDSVSDGGVTKIE